MRSLAFALCVFPLALDAQQEVAPKTAALKIAFLDSGYTLSLSVPASEIVGFELPASSAEEKAKVAVAISDLSQPMTLFAVTAEAGCATATANVALVGGEAGSALGPDDHRPEFQAEYTIRCSNLQALGEMRFDYFDRFSQAERVDVRVQSPGGSHAVAVTRETPLVDLSEFM
ncbi:ZrgA family zinc uptake protein [Ruegeria arenilitoris]|uniref:ZrgA family zinc uptake protein n=1 Tax=Ruegeria arenilitoris TaxID=1173585 RepID=UPI00147EBB03|nr:DUF2796 domain-containing protein [Ruegeria arenilitoris]